MSQLTNQLEFAATTPRQKKRQTVELSENNTNKSKRPKQQLPNREKEDDEQYKSIDSIQHGLICVYQDPDTDFKTSDYVQRAVNDIAFCAKKNEEFPVIFQLADDAYLHVCLSEESTTTTSPACHLFDTKKVNDSGCNECELCRILGDKELKEMFMDLWWISKANFINY